MIRELPGIFRQESLQGLWIPRLHGLHDISGNRRHLTLPRFTNGTRAGFGGISEHGVHVRASCSLDTGIRLPNNSSMTVLVLGNVPTALTTGGGGVVIGAMDASKGWRLSADQADAGLRLQHREGTQNSIATVAFPGSFAVGGWIASTRSGLIVPGSTSVSAEDTGTGFDAEGCDDPRATGNALPLMLGGFGFSSCWTSGTIGGTLNANTYNDEIRIGACAIFNTALTQAMVEQGLRILTSMAAG